MREHPQINFKKGLLERGVRYLQRNGMRDNHIRGFSRCFAIAIPLITLWNIFWMYVLLSLNDGKKTALLLKTFPEGSLNKDIEKSADDIIKMLGGTYGKSPEQLLEEPPTVLYQVSGFVIDNKLKFVMGGIVLAIAIPYYINRSIENILQKKQYVDEKLSTYAENGYTKGATVGLLNQVAENLKIDIPSDIGLHVIAPYLDRFDAANMAKTCNSSAKMARDTKLSFAEAELQRQKNRDNNQVVNNEEQGLDSPTTLRRRGRP